MKEMAKEINVEIAVEQCRASDLKADRKVEIMAKTSVTSGF